VPAGKRGKRRKKSRPSRKWLKKNGEIDIFQGRSGIGFRRTFERVLERKDQCGVKKSPGLSGWGNRDLTPTLKSFHDGKTRPWEKSGKLRVGHYRSPCSMQKFKAVFNRTVNNRTKKEHEKSQKNPEGGRKAVVFGLIKKENRRVVRMSFVERNVTARLLGDEG